MQGLWANCQGLEIQRVVGWGLEPQPRFAVVFPSLCSLNPAQNVSAIAHIFYCLLSSRHCHGVHGSPALLPHSVGCGPQLWLPLPAVVPK